MKAIILFILAWATIANGQLLQGTRTTNWTNPGCDNIFIPPKTVSIMDFGADSTGINPSDEALKKGFTFLKGAGKITFPKGKFLFKTTISIPDSTILEGTADPGSGLPVTTIIIATVNDHGFKLSGELIKTKLFVIGPMEKDQTSLTLSEQGLKKGDLIQLYPYDDSSLVFSSWGRHSTGQILLITKVEENKVWINKPLRRSYSLKNKPAILKLIPRQQVHIRNLVLINQNKSTWQTSNIYLNYSFNCSISNIESYMGNFAHIEISNSSQVTVERSYFKDAFSYGSGGAGYGIALQYTSGDCFLHSNVLEHLRHSILLQAGANGNVIAYNYSLEPYWTGTFLPSNSAGDIVLHGNYVYLNLFEGNVVQNIVIDNSHGFNGPYNTFFRNRAELYGIVMNNSPSSNNQNFIGNQVVNTSAGRGNYLLQGSGHISSGNIIKGNTIPAGTSDPEIFSMFDYNFSKFYNSVSTTPPISHSNWQQSSPHIEAEYRRANNRHYILTPIQENLLSEGDLKNIKIWPNPFKESFLIETNSNFNFELYDLNGKVVMKGITNHQVFAENLQKGTYLIHFSRQIKGIKVEKE